MAKGRKPKNTDTDNDNVSPGIEEDIIKKFGDIISNANNIKESREKIISVSPKINLILGGGIPEGTMTILTGPPGVGKSLTALHIAGNAQREPSKYGERPIFYFDIEARLKYRDLEGNKNLDLSKIKIIKSEPGNILFAEKFIDIAEQLINSIPGGVFIFDSFSALCTEARLTSDVTSRYRDDTPLLLSGFCKRIAQTIAVNRSIIIGITHMIANQSPMSRSPWMEASGRKLQYQADVKLNASHSSPWLVKDEQIGQEVNWVCTKCPIKGPGNKTSSWIKYGKGIDTNRELLDLAIDIGLIRKKGAFYRLDYNNQELVFHGIDNALSSLDNDLDLSKFLETKVVEMYS